MVYKPSGPDSNDHDETEDRFDSDDASRSIEDPEVLEPSEIFDPRIVSEYPGPSDYDISMSERDHGLEGNSFTGQWLKSAGGVLLVFAALGLLLSLVGPLSYSGGDDTSNDTFKSALVEEVLDGNTIIVKLDGKTEIVRYIGVSVGVPGESYYRTAQLVNRSWVGDQTVLLERDGNDRDIDGRLLRYIYVDNQMVNAALLINGLARYMPHHANNRYESVLLSAEESAREAGRGMWNGDDIAEVRPA